MTKKAYYTTETDTKPIKATYSLMWDRLKNFPKGVAVGSMNPPKVSGPAAAALISVEIGWFLMMVSHHWADTAKAREKIIWAIGSWIPGSHNPSKLYGNVGPTSGKETILLIGWLLSWAILHLLWRNRDIRPRTMFFWFAILLIAATAMNWHPLFPYLQLMPRH